MLDMAEVWWSKGIYAYWVLRLSSPLAQFSSQEAGKKPLNSKQDSQG